MCATGWFGDTVSSKTMCLACYMGKAPTARWFPRQETEVTWDFRSRNIVAEVVSKSSNKLCRFKPPCCVWCLLWNLNIFGRSPSQDGGHDLFFRLGSHWNPGRMIQICARVNSKISRETEGKTEMTIGWRGREAPKWHDSNCTFEGF